MDRSSPEYLPLVAGADLPWLTVDEMREIDRAMVEELGIALEQMMENAGRSVAVLARRLLGGSVLDRSIAVLAGPGGNGGGGLVAARHLAGAGAHVRVVLGVEDDRLAPVTRRQLGILGAIGIPVGRDPGSLGDADLVVDALLGYSQSGGPRAQIAALIDTVTGSRILSLDVPSGLELATGELHEPHIRADATLTLAAPKAGLRGPAAGAPVGELYLADISVPDVAFSRAGIEWHSPFAAGPLVRVV